uniref:Uncharacterized protein n=1 Tax=Arion vulgaris TaxID=1028688 RepID=A0A0B6ZYF3_9EUPU
MKSLHLKCCMIPEAKSYVSSFRLCTSGTSHVYKWHWSCVQAALVMCTSGTGHVCKWHWPCVQAALAMCTNVIVDIGLV